MSVEIGSCDPDVDITCDGCDEDIAVDDNVYCTKCANRQKEEKTQCSVCYKQFPKGEMFSKVAGRMCHHCAFQYEARAAGLLPTRKTGTQKEGSGPGIASPGVAEA